MRTQPNSGWPGTPHNHGTWHAPGEYIHLVDYDDTFVPEAREAVRDAEGAVALAERASEVKVRSEVSTPSWEDGRPVPDITLGLLSRDGEPLVLVERNEKLYLDPELLDGVPGTEDSWEIRDPFRLAYAELVVKDQDREDWWYPEGDLEIRLRPLSDGRSQLVAVGGCGSTPRGWRASVHWSAGSTTCGHTSNCWAWTGWCG